VGYNLYITRRKHHWDEDGPDITEDEWRALVESDPELEFREPRVPLKATWSGKSEYPDPWLDHCRGCIDTKNPDKPLIGKMLDIAEKLGAKVQGDDGEVYRTPTEYCFEEEPASPAASSRRWWDRLWRHLANRPT